MFLFCFVFQKCLTGNSLAVQWLGLYIFTAEGVSLIPGWGTKILQVVWFDQNKTKQNKKTLCPICQVHNKD